MENPLDRLALPRPTTEAQKDAALDAISDIAKAIFEEGRTPWGITQDVKTILVLATHKCDISDLPKK